MSTSRACRDSKLESMAAASSPPVSRAQRRVATLVMVVLVLAPAWQLAYWTWVFLAPPAAEDSRAAGPAVDLAAIAHLFDGKPPAGSTPQASTSGLRLKGVIAPTPGVAASAIFSTGSGKDIAVYVGREIMPGVKLSAVYPDRVMLSRAGVEERIDLEVMRGGGKSTMTAGTRGPGFRVNVARPADNHFALSRKELDDALRDPGQ